MKKKIVKTSAVEKICALTLVLLIAFVAYLGYLYYDKNLPTFTADLSEITVEEKQSLIDGNYLELMEYPDSLQYVSVTVDEGVRETQYKLEFCVNKHEAQRYEIEKGGSPDTVGIKKRSEDDSKVYYEASTNFTTGSGSSRWSYVKSLAEKYEVK